MYQLHSSRSTTVIAECNYGRRSNVVDSVQFEREFKRYVTFKLTIRKLNTFLFVHTYKRPITT